MKDVLRLVALLAVMAAAVAASAVGVAIARSWRPEHTNAIVYGLLGVSGLVAVSVVAVAGLLALVGLGALFLRRQGGGAYRGSPELIEERQRLQVEHSRLGLIERLLGRSATVPLLTTSRTFVDLAPTEED